MRFEWDERKRAANLAKHGLDCRRAVQVFDRPSFTFPSPRLDEERWITVGEAYGRLARWFGHHTACRNDVARWTWL